MTSAMPESGAYRSHRGFEIKSAEEIAKMRRGCGLLRRVREEILEMVRPGVTTLALDRKAQALIEQAGAVPAFLGHKGFPGTLCVSINEEVVHGIPSASRVLTDGDIVSLDLGLILEGFYADTAVTVPVGDVDETAGRLLEVGPEALSRGIEQCVAGRRLGDISAAIQDCVEKAGFSVVQEYTGHGIGRRLHEDPKVPNFGVSGKGPRLREGLTLALEPMLNEGTWETETLDDGWTVVTKDRKRSAHFEHTVVVGREEAEILT